jgi:hypothetical protein
LRYHQKVAVRLLSRPLRSTAARQRSGPKPIYDPAVLLPVLKEVWLASDQLCSKLLKAALPEWLGRYEQSKGPLAADLKAKLLAISPAQIDRLLQPARVRHPRKGLGATQPGTLLRRQVPTRGGPPDTSKPGSVEADMAWPQCVTRCWKLQPRLSRSRTGGDFRRGRGSREQNEPASEWLAEIA